MQPGPTGRIYARIVRDNVLTFVNIVIASLCLALAVLGEWSDAVASILVVARRLLRQARGWAALPAFSIASASAPASSGASRAAMSGR